ncbi:tRNA1(Val) (adenine(37)-N6)-methyltransferase [Aquiflexum sp.]|uniref:tRNA1(Val) (adenine(37)-N6)-methyltransferase n=1 Tax=Aquiflexum sp. TaxID=1872584 RepID=UPI0035937AFD
MALASRIKDSSFRFKQFTVHQDRCGMKISTDGVVLGAFAGRGNPKNILDIGAGTGVVSLMLAQRFPNAMITGIEIDKDAAKQASENIHQSPWSNRIKILNQSLQEFQRKQDIKFDLIVSNPPYFPKHLKSIDQKRNLALHNDSLSFFDLANGIYSLMENKGHCWLILPPEQMDTINKIFEFLGLFITEKLDLRDKQNKNIIRTIQDFSYSKGAIKKSIINIKDESGEYSKDYSELLNEFLIIF